MGISVLRGSALISLPLGLGVEEEDRMEVLLEQASFAV